MARGSNNEDIGSRSSATSFPQNILYGFHSRLNRQEEKVFSSYSELAETFITIRGAQDHSIENLSNLRDTLDKTCRKLLASGWANRGVLENKKPTVESNYSAAWKIRTAELQIERAERDFARASKKDGEIYMNDVYNRLSTAQIMIESAIASMNHSF